MNVQEFTAFAKEAYNPQKNKFSMMTIPKMRYLMINGKGNPEKQNFGAIMKWFYGVVHESKPVTKKIMGKNFGYPPPEYLFWSKNKDDFISGNKDKWLWRVMIACAEFKLKNIIDDAIA